MRKLQRQWSMMALVVGSLAGAAAFAQQAQPQQRAPAGRAAQPAGQPAAHRETMLDEHVAACLILENDNEIAAAKIAEKNARSDDVKDFAKTMVKDHEKFVADLDRFSGGLLRNRGQRAENQPGAAGRTETAAGREPRRDGRAAATNNATTNNAPNAAPRANTAAARGGQDPWAQMLTIKEEIANECQAATRRELDSKKGEEFDECYMGMQIGAHMHLIDSLKVLERHVSPDLQPVLQKGLQTAQAHLDRAKKIKKNVTKLETASDGNSTKTK
jgi:predicted outer membrane protein